MRASILIALCGTLVLSATRANAQDLQYRTRMEMIGKSMPGDMPVPTITISYKNPMVRTETEIPGAGAMPARTMVGIIDFGAHKITMLNPDEKTYVEMSMPDAMAHLDSSSQRIAKQTRPDIKETGEQKQIDGYTVVRQIGVVDVGFAMPSPTPQVKEGMKMVMVMEQWVSKDPRLTEAYQAFGKAFGSQMGMNQMAMLAAGDPRAGLPIQSTIIMVQVPKAATVDPEAVLKTAATDENIIMKTTMHATDIRTGLLDPALFIVPKDYVKQELP